MHAGGSTIHGGAVLALVAMLAGCATAAASTTEGNRGALTPAASSTVAAGTPPPAVAGASPVVVAAAPPSAASPVVAAGSPAAAATPAAATPAAATPAAASAPPAPRALELGAPVVAPASPIPTPADPAPADQPPADPAPAAPPAPVRSGANVNAAVDVGDPVRVLIPSVGIDGAIVAAGVLDDGTVDVPPDASLAGWFTGGPRPGELGPAVIVGHVDSKESGPGVFYRLRNMRVGDIATVVTTTGSQQFVAVAKELVAKSEFPTARVYGAVPATALRLITCGGSFDRTIGHYRDNVVVYLVKVGA